MNRHPPGAQDVARRLLHHEGGGSAGPGGVADAVERAWRKLSAGLEPLVGRGGADALITRAVNLAKREHPFLGVVRPAVDAPIDFVGLRASLESQDEEAAAAAAVAVLTSVLGLLVGLLGEDLGLRPVQAIWPDVTPGVEPPQSIEGKA
jgi:hypothetical protein